MSPISRLPVLALIPFMLSACGGLPGEYADVLASPEGPAAVGCRPATEPGLVGVLGIDNPGELPIEIVSVEFVDASPRPVESYVLAVPASANNTISGVGSVRLANAFEDSPELAAAWENRQGAPREIPPGFDTEIVVVFDRAHDVEAVSYVNEIRVTVAVGGDTETATFESLRMAGMEDGCDATRAALNGHE